MNCKQFNWEYSFGALLLAVTMAVITCLLFVAMAPHEVDYYYASKASQHDTSVCVYAHWTWHADELSFCSDDYSRALDFLAKANSTISNRKDAK